MPRDSKKARDISGGLHLLMPTCRVPETRDNATVTDCPAAPHSTPGRALMVYVLMASAVEVH